jgi:hypothetical protein
VKIRGSPVLVLQMVALLAVVGACSGSHFPVPSAQPVAVILILDSFGSPSQNQGKHFGSTGNCAVTSMSSQVAGGHGAGDVPPNTSHGQLVLTELETELRARHFTQVGVERERGELHKQFGLPTSAPWVRDLDMWREGISDSDPLILLVGVDTDDYRTTTITKNIRSLTGNFRLPTGKRLEGFVLNMSFEIVPCAFVTGAVEIGPEQLSLAHYLEIIESSPQLGDLRDQFDQLRGNGENGVRAGLENIRSQHPDLSERINGLAGSVAQSLAQSPDELKTYLDAGDIIPVAASGNGLGAEHLPLPFPFAPGVWPGVVSVSAEDPQHPQQSGATAWYSNHGEILLSGVLSYPGWNAPLEGTSFAAPRLSVLEASYLVHGGSVPCSGAPGPRVPPLGYHVGNESDFVWASLLPESAGRYCPSFLNVASG